MSATPSTMLPLGTPLPVFTLTDTVTGNPVSLDDCAEQKGLLVMFICNHCPFVKHVFNEFGPLATEYQEQGIGFVAISSNDIEAFPEDGPGPMKALAQEKGWPFPYLYDETQDVAKAFQAACTPDLFLFDGQFTLMYRGQFDSSRPSNNIPVTGSDIRSAMDALIQGNAAPEPQIASIGCNIKWKEGNNPPYFD